MVKSSKRHYHKTIEYEEITDQHACISVGNKDMTSFQ